MGDELESWVSSQLAELLGFTDDTLTSFVLALSRGVRGAQELHQKLGGAGVSDTPASRRFAMELFRRVPRASAAAPAAAAAPRAASNAQALRESQRYRL